MTLPHPQIYLDYNATTPVSDTVLQAMLPWLRDGFGNPSSNHSWGVRARDAVEAARSRVAAALGAQPDEILFTSGGTEANNLAIRGLAQATSCQRFVTSTVEHPATSEPLAALEAAGAEVVRLATDAEGCAVADGLGRSEQPTLVTVMHANNEMGAVQPVKELSALGHWTHTDAAQSIGKIPVNVDELGVDLLSLAGHKVYAPKGVGALYIRRGTPVAPVLLGAGHERGIRPGTENVASIVGLGVALTEATHELEQRAGHMRAMVDLLWTLLAANIPDLTRNGAQPERALPNTLNVSFPRVSGSAILARAPSLAASTGSACHEDVEHPSTVLLAMGLPAERALGAVRLSVGVHTTESQIRVATAALTDAWQRVCRDPS